MDSVSVAVADGKTQIDTALSIRAQVFQAEQNIAREIDFDEKDESAIHFLAFYEDSAVGTCRARLLDEGKTAKIERMAVLKEYRGKGIGTHMLNFVEQHLREQGIEKITTNAQCPAKPFYQKLGYNQEGETFQEAGIDHVQLTKNLPQA